jgi:hypothetical protein
VDLIRLWIETFLRGRIGYEGPRAFWVLAASVLIGALLVAVLLFTGPLLCVAALALLLALWALRGLPSATAAVLIGAIVIAGWLLIATLRGSLLIPPLPRFTADGSAVVRNGVAAIVVCGGKRGYGGMEKAVDYVPEPRTGTWGKERRGGCMVYYHHPPGWEQRHNRHERAQE